MHRHVIENLPPQQNRKRNICLETLQTISEDRSDSDLTERAKSYLRMLLRFGMQDFEDSVKHVVRTAGCACSRFSVRERKPYKDYDLGEEKCSKVADQCGIAAFLKERKELTGRILAYLQALDSHRKTEEPRNAQAFLEGIVDNVDAATRRDPCLRVGDLVIAMESAGIPDFYTLNAKECRHLCRTLNQNMIVRPKNHIHEDIICPSEQRDWTALIERPRPGPNRPDEA
ncbi:MAG: hypothetical protein ACP5XB_18300 [Isosphaeraceae bacterium]